MQPENTELAGQAYQNFLRPYNPEEYQGIFQQSFIDPAVQQLQRQIIPAIQQQLGVDESGSGALNRALAQSATDLGTALGSQMMNFYNQQQANQVSALGGLSSLLGVRSFEPMVTQRQGLLNYLLSGAGELGQRANLPGLFGGW